MTDRAAYPSDLSDAGVSLRDVQIAARHADPRTTMRYDRARKNLDRHPNYIFAAYMACGTCHRATCGFAEMSAFDLKWNVSYSNAKDDNHAVTASIRVIKSVLGRQVAGSAAGW
jgi:hypothetical protein